MNYNMPEAILFVEYECPVCERFEATVMEPLAYIGRINLRVIDVNVDRGAEYTWWKNFTNSQFGRDVTPLVKFLPNHIFVIEKVKKEVTEKIEAEIDNTKKQIDEFLKVVMPSSCWLLLRASNERRQARSAIKTHRAWRDASLVLRVFIILKGVKHLNVLRKRARSKTWIWD